MKVLDDVRQDVANYVPIDAFRCSCVSKAWKKLWDKAFPHRFVVDVSKFKHRRRASDGLRMVVRFVWIQLKNVTAMAQRIQETTSCIDVNFDACNIGNDGALALAERFPSGLKSLSLRLRKCITMFFLTPS